MRTRLVAVVVVGILVGWIISSPPIVAGQPVVLEKADKIQLKSNKAKPPSPPGQSGGSSSAPKIGTQGLTWNHGNTCNVNTWQFNANGPSGTKSAITVGIDTPSGPPPGTNPLLDAQNAISGWLSAISNFVTTITYSSSGLITTAVSQLCFSVNGPVNNQWSGGSGGGGYDVHFSFVSEFPGEPNVLGVEQTYYFIGTYVIAFALITVAMSPGCCGNLSDPDMQNIAAHEFGHANALLHSNYPGVLPNGPFELMYPYIYGGSSSITLGSSANPIIRPSNLDVYALSSLVNSSYNNGPGVYYWFSLVSSLARPGKSQTDPWIWAPL